MKSTVAAIVLVAVLIGGAILFGLKSNPSGSTATENANNVSVVDGKQIIEITAKGGYSPKISVAKAGMPTVIRFKTNGTFDCSSLVRIPSMKVAMSLPPSGTTDIDLGSPQAAEVQGLCAMAMYNFKVQFN